MALQRLGACLWAKTGADPETRELTHWLPLPVHLRDTAEVAAMLVRHRMSAQQRGLLTDALPAGIDPERIGWLLGALHDTGKSGPAFQGQVEPLAARLYDESGRIDPTLRLDVRDAAPVAAQSEFPHALASEVIVTRVLAEDCGLARAQASGPASAFASFRSVPGLRPLPIAHQLGSVLGAHHGFTAPESTAVDYLRRAQWPARLGTPDSPWHAVQRALTLGLIEESGAGLRDPAWADPDVSLDSAVLSLLTGMLIQADWIASNQDLFPLIPVDASADACEPSAQRALRAWEQLALPSLWSAVPQLDVDDALRFRFSLPEGAAARPGQRVAHRATAGGEGPRLVILEDETGSGKTEAALLAAENLAAATGATGLFIGLPTQATANSIFARVTRWLHRLPTGGQGVGVSASLAHGKARLSREFTALGRLDPCLEPDVGEAGLPDDAHSVGEPRGTDASGSRILRPGTHAWLSGRKKRVLADFVVGTVDQLLMAALAARHVMLRHSGFADKVVLLDEVHAADTTMRVFLRHGLTWLGRWGVPVVMLTATLPPAQKRDLATAYQEGLRLRRTDEESGPAEGGTWGTGPRTGCAGEAGGEVRSGESTGGAQAAYPALTVVSENKVLIEPIVAGGTRTTALHELADDEETLVETLRGLLREGGCVAVIRNSVARVQEAAARLRVEFGEDVVTIAHARYAASDRAAKDRWLLEAFGRDPAQRPDRAIVVASQVIEQSLDIDFDAIITDMCPVDLLIQRLGRVHRHLERVRPEPVRTPRCYLTGMDDWAGSPPVPVPASRVIYGEHLLLRSVAAVRQVCGSTDGLTTPDAVLPLVHTVYGESPVGPDAWQAHLERAAADQEARDRTIAELAERWALRPESSPEGLDGWLSVMDGDPEDADPYNRERGHVRDGAESIEVLLVLTDGTGWRSLDWLPRAGGRPIPEDDRISSSVAEAVAESSVRLPFAMARGTTGDRVIAALERWGKAGLQRSPLLRGQLILPLTLSDDGRTAHARVDDWDVVYDRSEGLSAHRWARPAGRPASASSEGDSA